MTSGMWLFLKIKKTLLKKKTQTDGNQFLLTIKSQVKGEVRKTKYRTQSASDKTSFVSQ